MSIPYFPFYPKDWLADTAHLSHEERGVFFDLLCHMWIRADGECSLPDDGRFLANLLGLPPARWRKLRAVLVAGLAPVLLVQDGRLLSKRLAQEFAVAKAKSNKAKQSANARWQPGDPDPVAPPPHSERDATAYANASANGYTTASANASPEHMLGGCYPESDLDIEIDLDQGASPPTPPAPGGAPPVDNFTPWFEGEFWPAYPARRGKKLNKAKARETAKHLPSRDWDRVVAAAHNYAESDQGRRGIVEDAHRFLRHWQDWETPELPDAQKGPDHARLTASEREERKLLDFVAWATG